MILDVFQDAWQWIQDAFQSLENIVNKNFDNPIMWIIIIVAILFMVSLAMKSLDGK